ncbi:ThuA domain-containing protein [Albibacterium sp.]|uniref:ThuA domain-containing protein n=1 Tax=Albibacterium sp. TaxID=2952885 RepID=UPI002B6F18A0|nr:ThuA domain-containing protein [Albibacterium sp.]HUH19430.1 ThuA domain-containing protein [Albibacterium sp.]
MKNKITLSLLFCFFLIFSFNENLWANSNKILVFSKTVTFRHSSAISAGQTVIQQLGKENNFEVEVTEDSQVFNSENLKQFDAVVFLCTTGDVLNDEQQEAFENYIQSGGGFVGIHSATDTEYDWPWYGELIGAYFKNHPRGQQDVLLNIIDANNISTSHLPQQWKKTDEIYNFKWIGQGLDVLITVDENSYEGGQNGEFHPISWFHAFDGGRSFYTALGHDEKSITDPLLVKHILGGIKYAMGRTK